MKKFDLDTFKIEEVVRFTFGRKGSMIGSIDFSIEGAYFFINYSINTEYTFNYLIINHDWVREENCPFCGKHIGSCVILSKYKTQIFEKLIQHPSIRLKCLLKMPFLYKKTP